MSVQVEFGIPGEVSFSYVHIKGTPEELGRVNYEMLGALFTSAMFSHKQAEKAAIERIQNGETALLPAPHGPAEEKSQEDYERLLKEELGASEVGETVTVGGLKFTKKQESPFPEHEHAYNIPDSASGSTARLCECGMEEPAAPYKAAPPAAKKKPWESEKPLPQVTVDIDAW